VLVPLEILETLRHVTALTEGTLDGLYRRMDHDPDLETPREIVRLCVCADTIAMMEFGGSELTEEVHHGGGLLLGHPV
jgi:hypothetical protein